VARRLVRQRGDVQATEDNVRAPPPVVIGDLIAPPGGRDVDLDRDQARLVVEVQALDVLVLQRDLVLGAR
jgi:hypothetical protein